MISELMQYFPATSLAFDYAQPQWHELMRVFPDGLCHLLSL